MKTAVCVFSVLCLINVSMVSSNVLSSLSCAEFGMTPMKNFKKERQIGLWYLQEVNPWAAAEDADCYTTLYAELAGQDAVATDIFHSLDLKTETRNVAVVTFDKSGDGSYAYQSSVYSATIVILSSDYNNYSVEWSCIDKVDHSESNVYVWTRSRSVTPATEKKIDEILDANHIDKTKVKKIKQDIQSCVIGLSKGGLLGGIAGLLKALLSSLG